MKIKVKPEDFIVEEIADIPLRKSGEFVVCLLRKRGWNTVDAIQRLSKELVIPVTDFSYGGKKDRHALTSQHVTIKAPSGKVPLPLQSGDGGNYSLAFTGFARRPMGPDLIKGNRFTITVRDLSVRETESICSEISVVKKTGYPNYFDDQRFGSFDLRQGFIAEKILKGHYNGALKIYLTHIYPEDKREEKERRRFFSENWGKWKECLNVAKTDFEQRAFEYLLIEPKGFVPLLQQISHEEMSLFFSAYQSFLWNEMMGRIIDQCAGERTCSYKGVTGEYLFFASLNRQGARYLKHLVLPTPASNAVMPDELTKTIYADVMGDHGMKPSLFNLRKIRQAFFKSSERKAVVVPQDLTSAVSDDELYDGKKKMGLRFVLPRGSYGTMFLKRITTPPPRRP